MLLRTEKMRRSMFVDSSLFKDYLPNKLYENPLKKIQLKDFNNYPIIDWQEFRQNELPKEDVGVNGCLAIFVPFCIPAGLIATFFSNHFGSLGFILIAVVFVGLCIMAGVDEKKDHKIKIENHLKLKQSLNSIESNLQKIGVVA